MSSRRPIWKHIVVWTAVIVLLLTLYVASHPCNFFLAQHYWPRAIPAVQAVYAPLTVYSRDRTRLGSQMLADYSTWAYTAISDRLIGDLESRTVLDSKTMLEFSNSPLRSVTRFLSEIHVHPVELDSEVDGEMEVTIFSRRTLREALDELLQPHGLLAWPARGRIVIGSPEAVQRMRAEDRAVRRVPPGAWVLLGLFLVSGAVLMWVYLRRRGLSHRVQPSRSGTA